MTSPCRAQCEERRRREAANALGEANVESGIRAMGAAVQYKSGLSCSTRQPPVRAPEHLRWRPLWAVSLGNVMGRGDSSSPTPAATREFLSLRQGILTQFFFASERIRLCSAAALVSPRDFADSRMRRGTDERCHPRASPSGSLETLGVCLNRARELYFSL